jgi:hypothetical protein
MKVTPKNDEIRKILRHPSAGGFRKEGPAEWPDDSYTARRIRDGDVTVETTTAEAGPEEPAAPERKRK